MIKFEVAGVDKVFHPAEAEIAAKNEIVVRATGLDNPVAVRYAFQDWVVAELYNSEGLPVSSFRTDHW